MKSKVLLLGAVVTAFAFTSFAAEPLLSPRAAGNQIRIVKNTVETPVTTIAYLEATPALLTPRAAGNQLKVVNGMKNDSNPALACRRDMASSPKAIAECAAHPGAAMTCCNLADVK